MTTPIIALSSILLKGPTYSIRASFRGTAYVTFEQWQAYDAAKHANAVTTEQKNAYLDTLDNDIALQEMIEDFSEIPAEAMPESAYFKHHDESKKALPNAFRIANGYLLVHKSIAEIIQAHQLGHTQLSLINLYDEHGDKCLYEGKYYFLNVAERRRYFLPEHSEGRLIRLRESQQYNMIEDGQVYTISSDAQQADVDLWHDPLLAQSLFLSKSLYQALETADLLNDLSMEQPCKVANVCADDTLPGSYML